MKYIEATPSNIFMKYILKYCMQHFNETRCGILHEILYEILYETLDEVIYERYSVLSDFSRNPTIMEHRLFKRSHDNFDETRRNRCPVISQASFIKYTAVTIVLGVHMHCFVF